MFIYQVNEGSELQVHFNNLRTYLEGRGIKNSCPLALDVNAKSLHDILCGGFSGGEFDGTFYNFHLWLGSSDNPEDLPYILQEGSIYVTPISDGGEWNYSGHKHFLLTFKVLKGRFAPVFLNEMPDNDGPSGCFMKRPLSEFSN